MQHISLFAGGCRIHLGPITTLGWNYRWMTRPGWYLGWLQSRLHLYMKNRRLKIVNFNRNKWLWNQQFSPPETRTLEISGIIRCYCRWVTGLLVFLSRFLCSFYFIFISYCSFQIPLLCSGIPFKSCLVKNDRIISLLYPLTFTVRFNHSIETTFPKFNPKFLWTAVDYSVQLANMRLSEEDCIVRTLEVADCAPFAKMW
jgi:hypothetical protein